MSIREQVNTDPDFIAIKRFNYSLRVMLEYYETRHQEIPISVQARALGVTESELEKIYEQALASLRGLVLTPSA